MYAYTPFLLDLHPNLDIFYQTISLGMFSLDRLTQHFTPNTYRDRCTEHLPPKPGVRGVALPHHSTPGP